MQKDSSIRINQVKVDGGMTKNQSFMQFLSDILNIKVIRPKILRTNSFRCGIFISIKLWYNKCSRNYK